MTTMAERDRGRTAAELAQLALVERLHLLTLGETGLSLPLSFRILLQPVLLHVAPRLLGQEPAILVEGGLAKPALCSSAMNSGSGGVARPDVLDAARQRRR
jgi:hypothetical protein